jgi:hypothetical protein
MTDLPRAYVGFNYYSGNAHAWRSKTKMKQGTKDRHFLVYVGGSADLAKLEAQQLAEASGRVKPQGHGPDN